MSLMKGTNFDASSLTALQKVTLRAVVMSFLFYGLAALEGTLMRVALVIHLFLLLRGCLNTFSLS